MHVRLPARLGIALITSLAVTVGLAAAPATADDSLAQAPADPGPHSHLGSYLAGRLAGKSLDLAAAAAFYEKALEQNTDSDMLLDAALQVEAGRGNWPRAETLAQRLASLKPTNRLAHIVQGIAAFKGGRYVEAESHFRARASHRVGELTNLLARAWILEAQGRTDAALAAIDAAVVPDRNNTFIRYHRALLADVAGRTDEAQRSYGLISKRDLRITRITLAYAHHAATAGDTRLARRILKTHIEEAKGDSHPYVEALLERIEAGERTGLLIATPADGLAELLYGLGDLLAREPVSAAADPVTLRLGMAFLQLSLYLTPDATFPLVALAGAHERVQRHEAAIDAYDRIPKGTPLEVSIAISKALNLNALKRVDEAKALLDDLAQRHPRDIRPLQAAGNVMRAHKRYAEAVDYYDRAIALIGEPQSQHWTYFYWRGACYERLKKLPQAEADLQRSLELSADQPSTLNYLGYTWIDHDRHLRKGLAMIEKAVRLKPDDGFIVDSLGWAHYRLGNFDRAVKYLEHAVALQPADPTLNDHLGDAYWRVGREREARFQWDQALKLNPEPEQAEKMRQKLKEGLPGVHPRQAKRGGKARRADNVK